MHGEETGQENTPRQGVMVRRRLDTWRSASWCGRWVYMHLAGRMYYYASQTVSPKPKPIQFPLARCGPGYTIPPHPDPSYLGLKAPNIPTNYMLAFPRLSNGSTSTNSPAAQNKAPLTYTGAALSKSANIATIGAIIPNTLFALAVIAFPVPRSLVGKISGV